MTHVQYFIIITRLNINYPPSITKCQVGACVQVGRVGRVGRDGREGGRARWAGWPIAITTCHDSSHHVVSHNSVPVNESSLPAPVTLAPLL